MDIDENKGHFLFSLHFYCNLPNCSFKPSKNETIHSYLLNAPFSQYNYAVFPPKIAHNTVYIDESNILGKVAGSLGKVCTKR